MNKRKNVRAIIMADGSSRRWGNYLDKPKHLIEIYGETILTRTVRLLRENDIEDIYITTHNKAYAMDGVKLYAPKNNVMEIDKMVCCQEIWGKDTLLIWGDTFFTNKAVATMVGMAVDDFMFFGRIGKNRILGWGTSEIFGLRVVDKKKVKRALREVKGKITGDKKTIADSSWTLYKYLHGVPLDGRPDYGDHMVKIDDLTEDFDYPREYKRFVFYINNRRVPRAGELRRGGDAV